MNKNKSNHRRTVCPSTVDVNAIDTDNAKHAFEELQRQARNNVPLSMEEIDEEINITRRELKLP